MKKALYLVFSLFGLLLFGSSYTSALDIGDVVVRFCDEEGVLEKKVSYEMNPSEEKDVCVKIFNTSNEQAKVVLGFVDGTVTKDASQYKACMSSQDVDNFAKFATMAESEYTIEPKSSVETSFSLQYPDSFAGMSYGCLTTMLGTVGEETDGGMLTIQLRQGHFVDVYVDGEIVLDVNFERVSPELNNIANSAFISVDKGGFFGPYTSSVSLINSGNVSQEVLVQRITKGLFGSIATEELGVYTLVPGESHEFEEELVIPWYKMFIEVNYEAYVTPQFDFHSDSITEEMKETGVISEVTTFFVIPYWLLIVLLILVLIVLYTQMQRRNKKPVKSALNKKRRSKKSKTTTTKKKTK